MTRRRPPKAQATLWGAAEPDPGQEPPEPARTARRETPEQLLTRVISETLALRVAWYGRFGVASPPLCPESGQHRTQRALDACEACAARCAADAKVREILIARSAEVAQGFTWINGVRERLSGSAHAQESA